MEKEAVSVGNRVAHQCSTLFDAQCERAIGMTEDDFARICARNHSEGRPVRERARRLERAQCARDSEASVSERSGEREAFYLISTTLFRQVLCREESIIVK